MVEILKPYVKNEEALAQVGLDTNILDDLKVNSARLVDVVLAFEDEFDIEIADDDVDTVNTVGDAVRLICRSCDSVGARRRRAARRATRFASRMQLAVETRVRAAVGADDGRADALRLGLADRRAREARARYRTWRAIAGRSSSARII